MTLHPPPDPGAAFALEDPVERVRAVLTAFYGFYRETEPMLGKLHSDRATVPELDDFMKENARRADRRRSPRRSRPASAPAASGRSGCGPWSRLALDFWTWRRLTREGLDDEAAAGVMAEALAMRRWTGRDSVRQWPIQTMS